MIGNSRDSLQNVIILDDSFPMCTDGTKRSFRQPVTSSQVWPWKTTGKYYALRWLRIEEQASFKFKVCEAKKNMNGNEFESPIVGWNSACQFEEH
jgi:hypothetical protein